MAGKTKFKLIATISVMNIHYRGNRIFITGVTEGLEYLMTDYLNMYRKQDSDTKFQGRGKLLRKGRKRHLSWYLKGE